MSKYVQWLYFPFALGILLFCAVMGSMIVNYFPVGKEVMFLTTKDRFLLHHPTYLTSFYIHIVASFISLSTGVFQFASFLYKINPVLHKTLGYCYILSILLLAAPSGFYISHFANGGLASQFGFYCLSIFWWLSTWKAFRMAKQHNFKAHIVWMMRSYAITLAAITLRTEGYLLHTLFKSNPIETYTTLSWLSWIGNLFIVEILLYLRVETDIYSRFFSNSK